MKKFNNYTDVVASLGEIRTLRLDRRVLIDDAIVFLAKKLEISPDEFYKGVLKTYKERVDS